MDNHGPLIAARDVHFNYSRTPALAEITLELPENSVRALVGPNGSGKTTLIKLLAGILRPTRGSIEWQGKDARSMPRRELARNIAFVPQEMNITFGLDCRETVMLGRTPHLRAFSGPSRHDEKVVDETMELTGTRAFANRAVTELSGGEKQRVLIAMALAQEPRVLLLDEPTVHLDINHQAEILELLQRLNRECRLTVLATMHDLNLASLFFRELVMLKQGRVIASGPPEVVLNAERIREAFEASVEIQPHPTREHSPQVVLLPRPS